MYNYYYNRFNAEQAKQFIVRFRAFLQKRAKRIVNSEMPEELEWYFYPTNNDPNLLKELQDYLVYLKAAGFVKFTPTDGGYFIVIDPKSNGRVPTVSLTHLRLPKTEHLAILTPKDFFAFINLITTSKITSSCTLSLNFAAAEISNFPTHPIFPYFMLLRHNYTFNPDYASQNWTRKKELDRLEGLAESRENQLIALQYILGITDKNILYFPTETMLDLELDWPELTDVYCVPQLA